jgi:hypothetical protein
MKDKELKEKIILYQNILNKLESELTNDNNHDYDLTNTENLINNEDLAIEIDDSIYVELDKNGYPIKKRHNNIVGDFIVIDEYDGKNLTELNTSEQNTIKMQDYLCKYRWATNNCKKIFSYAKYLP